MSDLSLENLSEDDRKALLAECYVLIDGMMKSFVELYGEVGIHSKPEGFCLHLGSEKGCVERTFMTVVLHGVDHYMADTEIDEIAKDIEFPPPEG